LASLGLWIVGVALLLDHLSHVTSRRTALLLTAILSYQPQMLQAVTTAAADAYIVFIVLAVVLLLTSLDAKSCFVLGFITWIGVQSRYQAFAAGVAVTLLLFLWLLRGRLPGSALAFYAGGSACAILLASPFYLFNLKWQRNPIWPVMIPAINGLDRYADRVAHAYHSSFTGSLTWQGVFDGLRGLLSEPAVFPIPMLALALPVLAFFRKEPAVRVTGFLTSAILVLWGLAQPAFFPRISMMLAPLVVVGFAPLLGVLRRLAGIAMLLLLGVFLVVVGVYSLDNVLYVISSDEQRWHRFTWFYDVYQWAIRSTPVDSRFLVVVESGQSYYLERPYRRADPRLSGVVDWPALNEPAELARYLRAEGYNYVIYQDHEWGAFPGGEEMQQAIQAAMQGGLLQTRAAFRLRLNTPGIRRQSRPARVWVLEVNRDKLSRAAASSGRFPTYPAISTAERHRRTSTPARRAPGKTGILPSRIAGSAPETTLAAPRRRHSS